MNTPFVRLIDVQFVARWFAKATDRSRWSGNDTPPLRQFCYVTSDGGKIGRSFYGPKCHPADRTDREFRDAKQ